MEKNEKTRNGEKTCTVLAWLAGRRFCKEDGRLGIVTGHKHATEQKKRCFMYIHFENQNLMLRNRAIMGCVNYRRRGKKVGYVSYIELAIQVGAIGSPQIAVKDPLY